MGAGEGGAVNAHRGLQGRGGGSMKELQVLEGFRKAEHSKKENNDTNQRVGRIQEHRELTICIRRKPANFKIITRKQLLLASLLCARHNPGHSTDIFLTLTTTP